MTGVRRSRIDLDGARISFLRAGDPASAATPALLLHGWPQESSMWMPVIERLASDRQILAPDLRGFGQSDAPGSGYEAPVFARDQIGLLDRLGIESVHLIGHDWGGWTAWLAALDHPDRIASALVLNAPHPWPVPGLSTLSQIPRSWYALALATPGLGAALSRHGGLTRLMLTWGSGGAIPPSRASRYAAGFRQPERAVAVSRLYRYYLRTFAAAASGRWQGRQLEVPAHLLFGAGDRMISPKVVERGLPEHAPRAEARVELVPGCGHFIADERPDLICERARLLWKLAEPSA